MLTDWQNMLEELLNDESDTMSAWEVEFIDSLNRQWTRHEDMAISPKQRAVLERIWDKVFGE